MMLRSLLCADEGRRRQKERGPSKAIKPRLFILETHISIAFSFVVCMYVCALVRQRGPSFINFRRSFSMHPKAPPSSLLSCFLVFTAFQFIPPPLSTHIKTGMKPCFLTCRGWPWLPTTAAFVLLRTGQKYPPRDCVRVAHRVFILPSSLPTHCTTHRHRNKPATRQAARSFGLRLGSRRSSSRSGRIRSSHGA
jgi:hypothetical protein